MLMSFKSDKFPVVCPVFLLGISPVVGEGGGAVSDPRSTPTATPVPFPEMEKLFQLGLYRKYLNQKISETNPEPAHVNF